MDTRAVRGELKKAQMVVFKGPSEVDGSVVLSDIASWLLAAAAHSAQLSYAFGRTGKSNVTE
ncbi:hypothetical protein ACVMB1_000226 [Bradyrhizobium sp. USDA 4504]